MAENEKKFCFKFHGSDKERTLAVCDKDLIGKTLSYQDVEIEVSPDFYGEETANGPGILEKVGMVRIVNIIGKDSVNLMIREDIVDKDCVLMIGDVPHVQIVKV